MPRDVKIQSRRGTASEWTSVNPVLALGELGVETDTHKIKAGDDETSWNDLPYVTGPVDGDNVSLQVKRDTDANLSALTTPIPDGTLVYNQTTGRMKIGDGETLWPNLPDPGKQFKNVVTVCKDGAKGSADFICSEYTDDADCFQDVLSNIQPYQKLSILQGSYEIDSTVSTTDQNIDIEGIGKVQISSIMSGSNAPTFSFNGSRILSTTLSADAAKGAIQVSLNNVTGLVPGQIIILNTNEEWTSHYAGFKTGESYKISSISGTTITLSEPLIRSYSTGHTANIYSPIRVSVKNIELIGNSDNTTDQLGIVIKYGNNVNISKNKLKYMQGGGIYLFTCYDTNVSSNSIEQCEKSGLGYGVGVADACAKIRIENNYFEACRHTVSCTTDRLIAGCNRDILINGNEMYGSYDNEGVIDSHPATINMMVTNNQIHGNGGRGFSDASQHSIFSNNEVWSCDGMILRDDINFPIKKTVIGNIIHDGYIYYDVRSQGYDDLIIMGNTCENGVCGIIVYYATKNANSVTIKNNHIKNTTERGIYLYLPGNTLPTQVNISDNNINTCGYEGILLNVASSVANQVEINHNLIFSPNTANNVVTGSGIKIYGVVNGIISKNIINDLNGYAGWGIREDSGCDYNILDKNKTLGCTGGSIYKVGGHSKFYDNSGYINQNSGTAIIAASGTSIVVSHGLVAAPTRVIVTPGGNIGNCWVEPASITATQFTITCSTAPEADIAVSWSAQVV